VRHGRVRSKCSCDFEWQRRRAKRAGACALPPHVACSQHPPAPPTSPPGGQFALYSLICRAAGFGPYGAAQPVDMHFGGAAAAVLGLLPHGFRSGHCWSLRTPKVGGALRGWYRRSPGAQGALLVVVMLTTAMVVGDGVLTPSISGASPAARGLLGAEGWRVSRLRPQPGDTAQWEPGGGRGGGCGGGCCRGAGLGHWWLGGWLQQCAGRWPPFQLAPPSPPPPGACAVLSAISGLKV
jgi:hypothetical protein